MHFKFIGVFYCIVVSDMFRPLMWPSSGRFVWEHEYSCVTNWQTYAVNHNKFY